MSMPRATYRVQFGPGFGFADATRLAPYLADLGISHVYCAPVFAARSGSTHGYDVIDHARFNPELGGEEGFRAMAAAFRAKGLGLLLDIVPNHMGIGPENVFWQSVLSEGPESPYASWFDIDWRSDYPGLGGKVLAPVLGESYGTALHAGDLELRVEGNEAAVWAHGTHKLPLRPEDQAKVLADPALATACRGVPGEPGSWRALDDLIARQHWRAAKFDLDWEAINYRRFFTVSDLAGVRVERRDVFEATHRLVLTLLEEGVIDGIRIDHIDGLRDPKGYALDLRAAVPRPFYLLVEKILAPDEQLPEDWETDGTTGYEFANLAIGVLVDPAAKEALTRGYADFIGARTDPAALVAAAKREIMDGRMAAQLDALTRGLHALAQADKATMDIGRGALRKALAATVASFEVYRTYADDTGMSDVDRRWIDRALAGGAESLPDLGPAPFDFLREILTGARPGAGDWMRRFQQFCGPVMAKGLEDTALYRFNRLIALNEVGSKPEIQGVSVEAFHRANLDRLAREPAAMLATSTHDTKRGEDARARIAAISSDPAGWTRATREWQALLARDAAPIDPNDAYFFYQLLLGVWPMDWRPERAISPEDLGDLAARVSAAMLKSVREASVNTRWVHGDPDYEANLTAFMERALAPGAENAFLAAFRRYEATLFAEGAGIALIQTALKLTVPGVPDIYQGAELWEQSLVDPDNRRAVDFDFRAQLARGGESGEPIASGAAKIAMTRRLLRYRAAHPDLFAQGGYEPLEVPGAPRLLGFTRRWNRDRLILIARLPGASETGQPPIPDGEAGEWFDLVTGDIADVARDLARNRVVVLVPAETASDL
jgi:(1->4)-alpha-D-glucan 1-alpha-D-glucosylmutase